jgi:aspartate aminotransferase
MSLSYRSTRIKPSPTLTIAARARQLQQDGKDIINLSIGEPDFDTPNHIKAAAEKAMRDGHTKYTPVDGIPSLKQAIINKFERENALQYTTKEVMVSAGCKQAIFNTLAALINPDDEVIIAAPYWVSYPDMILLVEGSPKIIETHVGNQFKITADQLDHAITPKTKLFIFNSPSNPTGMMYTEQELKALANVLIKHPHVFIISDDIYEYILWNKLPFKNLINVCPELKSRTVICHGVSKTYAMTGWRIGFAAGDAKIINAMTIIQSQSTSNPNSIAQYAAQAALEGDPSCIKTMTDAYQRRHQIFFDGLKKLSGIKIQPADGAFYCFPDFSDAMKQFGHEGSDIDFAEFILNETGIVGIPGSAFGSPGCMRLSTAASDALLQDAMKRLEKLWQR